jgi:hypothetical protein
MWQPRRRAHTGGSSSLSEQLGYLSDLEPLADLVARRWDLHQLGDVAGHQLVALGAAQRVPQDGVDELDLPLGRRAPAALPHRAAPLILRTVLVVAVETAQALGTADGDEPADIRPGELVESNLPERRPNVESYRALVPAVRGRPLGLLHFGEPVIQVLPDRRRPIRDSESVR